jgi:hypothetical protein
MSSIRLGRFDSCFLIVSVELGFSSWVEYFGFGSWFSGWVMFWVKNHSLCSTRGLLWIKNYGQYPTVVLVGLNQVFF